MDFGTKVLGKSNPHYSVYVPGLCPVEGVTGCGGSWYGGFTEIRNSTAFFNICHTYFKFVFFSYMLL